MNLCEIVVAQNEPRSRSALAALVRLLARACARDYFTREKQTEFQAPNDQTEQAGQEREAPHRGLSNGDRGSRDLPRDQENDLELDEGKLFESKPLRGRR